MQPEKNKYPLILKFRNPKSILFIGLLIVSFLSFFIYNFKQDNLKLVQFPLVESESFLKCHKNSITGDSVNIGFSLGKIGYRIREFETFVNSILHYRTCPIKFFIQSDQDSRNYIINYFKHIPLEELQTLEYIVVVKNGTVLNFKVPTHYDFVLGKMMMETAFLDLDSVVVFDFDLIAVADICEMIRTGWKMMSKNSFFGIPPSVQPTACQPGGQFHFAAVATNLTGNWRCLNSGTMFQNLTNMRRFNWNKQWQELVTLEFQFHKDILDYPEGTLILYTAKRNWLFPEFLVVLPVGMNLDLGWLNKDYIQSCIDFIPETTIIHGPSSLFRRENWVSNEIWWLYAPIHLNQYYQNKRPEFFLQKDSICRERLRVKARIQDYGDAALTKLKD